MRQWFLNWKFAMFRWVLLVAALLAIPAVAHGQTHPCDQPPPPQSTIQSSSPHKVQFCLPQTDAPEAILAKVDGQPFDLVAVAAKTGPSTTGKVLYESAPFIQVPKGTHQLEVAAYNRNALTGTLQLGAFSSPLAFAAVDDTPKPAAPEVKGVVK
jgi:hypothetical protein